MKAYTRFAEKTNFLFARVVINVFVELKVLIHIFQCAYLKKILVHTLFDHPVYACDDKLFLYFVYGHVNVRVAAVVYTALNVSYCYPQ